RLGGYRLAGRALAADEQQRAAVRDQSAHELGRLLVQRQRLIEVDDVDLVALSEDELGHLRVPEAGLVPKMHAPFQHPAHRHVGHGTLLRVSPPRSPADDPVSRAPGQWFNGACVVLSLEASLPLRRALYTIAALQQQRRSAPPESPPARQGPLSRFGFSGGSAPRNMTVTIKTPEKQEKMRGAGRLAAGVRDMIGPHPKPRAQTEHPDQTF